MRLLVSSAFTTLAELPLPDSAIINHQACLLPQSDGNKYSHNPWQINYKFFICTKIKKDCIFEINAMDNQKCTYNILGLVAYLTVLVRRNQGIKQVVTIR